MASREVEWMKKRYRESSLSSDEGPSAAKKVKFSEIEDEIRQQFPSSEYSHSKISQLIQEAFPSAERKRIGKKALTYVLGIEPSVSGLGSCEHQPLQLANQRLQEELCQQKQENLRLQEEISRLHQLMIESEQAQALRISPSLLESQMQATMNPSSQVYSGPNSLQRFQVFSIDSVIAELKTHAPDLYKLIVGLGSTRTIEEGEVSSLSELRAATSMCILLKNRSMRVLGVQLLLTYMLIARATSKQVQSPYFATVYTVFTDYNAGNTGPKPCWGMCIILDSLELP